MGLLQRVAAAVAAAFRKAAPPQGLTAVDGHRGGWFPLSRWAGGNWQADVEVRHDSVLAQATVFACITLIAADIGKLRLRVVQQYGRVWLEKTTPGYSELMNRPNAYQTRQQFVEQWIISKLSHGNAYILKERRQRRVVGLYVLDANLVTPLVAPDGSVYYQLQQDYLSGVPDELPAVPASEIIHDRFNCLFHPLVGLSPIFASGLAATQALRIQRNSAKFFENMARPSGILTAPTKISDETAKRLKEHWETNYSEDKIGKIAVLGDGLKFDSLATNAVDAQLVEQLKISAEQVCSTFHVPGYMVGVAAPPAQGGVDGEQQRYYNQCLQALIEAAEACLDEGIGLDKPVDGNTLGSDFDLDGLLRMDSRTLAEVEALKLKGITSPDESRQKFNLLPVKGGASVYLQQQNFSLEALAKRDASDDPFGTAAPAPAPAAGAKDLEVDLRMQKAAADLRLAEALAERADTHDAAARKFMSDLVAGLSTAEPIDV